MGFFLDLSVVCLSVFFREGGGVRGSGAGGFQADTHRDQLALAQMLPHSLFVALSSPNSKRLVDYSHLRYDTGAAIQQPQISPFTGTHIKHTKWGVGQSI